LELRRIKFRHGDWRRREKLSLPDAPSAWGDPPGRLTWAAALANDNGCMVCSMALVGPESNVIRRMGAHLTNQDAKVGLAAMPITEGHLSARDDACEGSCSS